MIRDDADYQRHGDDVHVNPLKHGDVLRIRDRSYSTFPRYVAMGTYPADRCGDISDLRALTAAQAGAWPRTPPGRLPAWGRPIST
ncbi:protein of unknown function [Methylococcus capsulatus]|uniref:Uncharacterized protein n=1 Tax=Methylococcus capsulatus TaxID=414 RepID=A0AA35UBZ4_METCP|nr:protein of unknown function [Methylococcus capsulatus]